MLFRSAKKYRDLLCSDSFKLNWKLTTPITLKNTTIKKCLENYENQNYMPFENSFSQKYYKFIYIIAIIQIKSNKVHKIILLERVYRLKAVVLNRVG